MDNQVKQVGGAHYDQQLGQCPECQAPLQHWDYAVGRPYLEMSVSKYVDRHREKGGFQGLLKAISFIHKIMKAYYRMEFKNWESTNELEQDSRVTLHLHHGNPDCQCRIHNAAREFHQARIDELMPRAAARKRKK